MTDPEPTQLDTFVAHFQWRVLQDALTEATAEHWERRASDLDQARTRRGDYRGAMFDPTHPVGRTASNRDRALATAGRRAQDRRLAETATACRRHAQLIRDTGLDTETRTVIAQVLIERHGPEQVVA